MKITGALLTFLLLAGQLAPAASSKKTKIPPRASEVKTKSEPTQTALKAQPLILTENLSCQEQLIHLNQRLFIYGHKIQTPELRDAEIKLDALTKEVSMRRTWGRTQTENQSINGSMSSQEQQACYGIQKYCGEQLDAALESLLSVDFTSKSYQDLERCHQEMKKHIYFGQTDYFTTELAQKCARKSEVLRKLDCLEKGIFCTPMELQVIQANKTWDEVEKMKKDAQTEVDRLEINLLHEMDQLSSIQISDASYGDDRDWYTYTITPGGKLKEFRKLNLLKMQIESYLQAKSEEKLGKLAFPNMKLTCRSAVHEPMTNKKSESTTNQGLK